MGMHKKNKHKQEFTELNKKYQQEMADFLGYGKSQRRDISDSDQKIVSMYAKGMTTRQISATLDDIHGFQKPGTNRWNVKHYV